MATNPDFVRFVSDQLEPACEATTRAMFGEYALYSKGKVVALICDDQLFVKPTEAGRTFLGEPEMAPPYPGAREHFRVGDRIEDSAWLSELIRLTEAELPAPKPKKPKKARNAR